MGIYQLTCILVGHTISERRKYHRKSMELGPVSSIHPSPAASSQSWFVSLQTDPESSPGMATLCDPESKKSLSLAVPYIFFQMSSALHVTCARMPELKKKWILIFRSL